jgi:hypothetical protein
LELNGVSGLTLAHLARISCSFPCLQEISFLDGARRGEGNEILESNLDFPANLKSINVCSSELATFLGWLLSQKNIPQLTTLRLHFMERSDIEVFTRLLQGVGDSLEHLEIGLAYFQTIFKDGLFREHSSFLFFFLVQSALNPRLIQDHIITKSLSPTLANSVHSSLSNPNYYYGFWNPLPL